MKDIRGCKWLLIAILLASVGCQDGKVSKAPPAPSGTEAQALLINVERLEHKFGLAVIAATPPKVGGNPFSQRDTENRLQKIDRDLEFINKCKPLGDKLMSAKASLKAFLNSPNDRDWNDAWRHLAAMHSGLVDFTGSSFWRGQVPPKESKNMTRHLELLKTSMARLTNR
jgi:hypothetical protein